MLWVVNQQVRQWELQLPNETQVLLRQQRGGDSNYFRGSNPAEALFASGATQSDLHDFPYYSTWTLEWKEAPVNMLSQQASWVVLQLQDDIQAMITKAEGDKSNNSMATESNAGNDNDVKSPT